MTDGAGWLFGVLAAAFATIAAYCWMVWAQAGGLQGLTLGSLFSALAVALSCHSFVVNGGSSDLVVATVERASWLLAALAAFALADIYAADLNCHRSMAARFWRFWIRLKKELP